MRPRSHAAPPARGGRTARHPNGRRERGSTARSVAVPQTQRMIRRLSLVAVSAVVPLALVPAAAQAAHWSGAEATGDATTYSFDPEPPPCGSITEAPTPTGDITRLVVRHTRTAVQLTLVVDGLRKATDIDATFDLSTHRTDWQVDVSRWDGDVSVDLMDVPEYPTDEELAQAEADGDCFFVETSSGEGCGRIRGDVDVDAGRITATVPRSCLGNPHWVRAGGSVYGSVKGGRGASFEDEWAPARLDDGDWRTPAYGPKVAHPKRAGR